jgi:glyceraldehyde 3-phosphate dehydrogenase
MKIAINGFGRIGRSVFRVVSQRPDSGIEIVAINDIADDEMTGYLLKYDTVMGQFPGDVTVADGVLEAGGHRVRLLTERDPAALPWAELEIDVVIEATGVFRTREAVMKHVEAGAKRVILTVPAKDELDATVVLGVNDDDLVSDVHIVSNASCTTNCLAPIAKILDDEFGIKRGVMTAVGKVLPQLDGKLDGIAMRVPVPDGSTVDLVVELETDVTVDRVNAAVRKAAEGPMKGIVQYSEAPLVSTDIIGNPHSSIFDAPSTQVLAGNTVKVLSWYDNEWGYSNRVVDLIERLGALEPAESVRQ